MADRDVRRRVSLSDTRRATKEWDPWLHLEVEDGLSANSRSCVFCGWTKVFVRKRAFIHFGYGGTATSERCRRIPHAVLQKFRNCGGVVPKAMVLDEVEAAISDSEVPLLPQSAEEPTVDEPIVVGPPHVAGPSHQTPNNPDSVDSTPTTVETRRTAPQVSRQWSMDEALQVGTRQKLNKLWASFFYEANIAFNVVRHPAFVKAVKETAAAGFVYQPPSYNAVRTKMIDTKLDAVKTMVSERTKTSIQHYGATICSDGWSDTNTRPLLNVMLVCPAGDVFLGSVDTTGEKKDIAYTANVMAKYIDEVGSSNVVQLCTDNASVMTGTLTQLKERYPHMYMQGCAAHIMDLLVEDWGKDPRVKILVGRCKQIVVFVKKYHLTLALFRKYSPNKSLRLPSSTRFAVHFLMIDRLVEVKQALHLMLGDEKYQPFEQSLASRRNGQNIQRRARVVREDIRSEAFWNECDNFKYLMEPALVALRVFDGKTPAMPKAWLVMKSLKEHVYSLEGPPYFLDSVTARKFEKNFDARWNLMRTDLHYAGALLNPYLQDVEELHNDGHAKSAFNKVIRNLGRSLGVDVQEAMAEWMQFTEKTGPFDPLVEAPDINAQPALLPHQWWNQVGGNALPKIAKRILSLTCSASSCERNWSMYSFVHNKVRNRLTTSKAEALVYIYTNSKLGRDKRGHNPATFYEKYLDDGLTDEENEEPLSSGSEDSNTTTYARRRDNAILERERLDGNPWAGLNRPEEDVVRPARRPYPNMFRQANVQVNPPRQQPEQVFEPELNVSSEEEMPLEDDGHSEEDIEHREENLMRPRAPHVSAWDVDPFAFSPPRNATIQEPNAEGENIQVPLVEERARSPIPVPSNPNGARTLRSNRRINRASANEEPEAPMEEGEAAEHPVPLANNIPPVPVVAATELGTDEDDNVPLAFIRDACNITTLNRQAPVHVGRTPLTSRPSSSRPPIHRGPPEIVDEGDHGSAPAPTQRSTQPSMTADPTIARESPIDAARRRNRKGKKRIMTTEERNQRDPKRPNHVVQPFCIGETNSTANIGQGSRRGRGRGRGNLPNIDGRGRGNVPNIDGITDRNRRQKRLVQTHIGDSVDMEVRNLNSEVEREVRPNAVITQEGDDDENATDEELRRGYETEDPTDYDGDEASNDDDFELD